MKRSKLTLLVALLLVLLTLVACGKKKEEPVPEPASKTVSESVSEPASEPEQESVSEPEEPEEPEQPIDPKLLEGLTAPKQESWLETFELAVAYSKDKSEKIVVRKGPDADSEELFTVEYGETLEILAREDGFDLIRTEEKEIGWLAGWNVLVAGESEPDGVDPAEEKKETTPAKSTTEKTKTQQTPAQPSQPEQPAQPSQPEQPTQPTQPEQPTQPDKPDQPSQPDEPDKPDQPDEPIVDPGSDIETPEL